VKCIDQTLSTFKSGIEGAHGGLGKGYDCLDGKSLGSLLGEQLLSRIKHALGGGGASILLGDAGWHV
jgi:hypothetical protein